MRKILNLTEKSLLFAGCLVLVLFAVGLALTLNTRSQQRQVSNQKDKEALLERVENSAEQPLKIVGNTDCPLKILQATVKEVAGAEFTQLTRKTTDLVTVSSVPEIRLLNTSGKTIAGFVLAVRHSESNMNHGIVQPKVSIAPGETYTVEREAFVPPDKLTIGDATGKTHEKLTQPKMDEEKYWVQFAPRSDLFVFVSLVVFDDGSEWKVTKGGEVK